MAKPTARRGRPPKSDGVETRARLLDAATTACVDQGFDGATLQEIARRAGVTATAIYNHFESREALLYAAGVRGLQRIVDSMGRNGHGGYRDIALAYLHPDMAQSRRLLAELHLAGRRDPQLTVLLQQWHAAAASELTSALGSDVAAPEAVVKTFFLLLLGLCHLDDLDAVDADPAQVTERVLALVDALH